jgi:hypothetical protein
MPMIPPVAIRRIEPRSSLVRRRSRPGTMPWGGSPRRDSRSRWRTSRGVGWGSRSADERGSPDSDEVTPEGYRDRAPRRLECWSSGRRLRFPWRVGGAAIWVATPAPRRTTRLVGPGVVALTFLDVQGHPRGVVVAAVAGTGLTGQSSISSQLDQPGFASSAGATWSSASSSAVLPSAVPVPLGKA